jgi:hypothetical protein|tara:strand:- start:44 stop:313 length:270 start_codon:yes stop_codon:yes gene_type:complete
MEPLWKLKDRKWFEQHPGESEYTRPFVNGEQEFDEGPLPQFVVVKQLAPGARTRNFIMPHIPGNPPGGYVALNSHDLTTGHWMPNERTD